MSELKLRPQKELETRGARAQIRTMSGAVRRTESPAVRGRECRSFGHADKLVGASVIEEPAIALPHDPFNKDYVWHLADFFPLSLWGEDGSVGARKKFAGIAAVEDGNAGAINEMVVGAVVDEDDALLGEDWRRAGFYDAGVKHSGAARKDR